MVANGCDKPLFPTSNILVSSVYPFPVYAIGNEDGFSLSFCYTCDVQTPAGPIRFKMDNIKVTRALRSDTYYRKRGSNGKERRTIWMGRPLRVLHEAAGRVVQQRASRSLVCRATGGPTYWEMRARPEGPV